MAKQIRRTTAPNSTKRRGSRGAPTIPIGKGTTATRPEGEVILREVKNGVEEVIEKDRLGGYVLVTEFGERTVSEAYVNSRLHDAGFRPYGPRMAQAGLPGQGKKR